MKTLGLVHRIDANANIRTDVVEADSEQLVLNVFRTVFGSLLTAADLLAGNRQPEGAAASDRLTTMTWRQWQSLNPVTVLGASCLHRGSGSAPVLVLAGPDSGFTLSIDPRAPLLCRVSHSDCLTIVDPCMSRQPTRLELGPAREHAFSSLGTTVFSPVPPALAERRNAQDTHPSARMPHHLGGEAIHVAPEPIDDPRPAKPPQWWAFLIPIAIGGVLAVVTGMWWFLLFSVSAPISGYVAYVMEKRRYARDCRQCAIDRGAAIETARRRLTALVADHKRSLQTRPGLCLGFGSARSLITIAEELYEGTDHLDGSVIVDDVPIRIDPLTTSVTVTGEHEQLRRMALSWLTDSTFDWDPSSELLHLPELQGSRFDHGYATTTPSSTAAATSTQAPRPLRRGPPDALIELRLSPPVPGPTATLHLKAPAASEAITLSLGSLAHTRTDDSSAAQGPVPGRPLIAALMPPGRFLTLERRRANQVGVERLPSHGLGDLYDDTLQSIRTRWESTAGGPVTIGRGTDGDITIDLFNDGPHALVAGTTGSGKSILLQTWLLAMALEHPPRRLTFVLIDFKGGATFAPLEDLPHTDSVLDDFDSATAFRALVSVRAEITRRERLLADHHCSDVLELDDPPPRLVVVIDEFHALMATHPKAADLLEHLTALGRSLGVHLILATQRPLGVITGHMKANINVRICLRVRDDADSFDVIGVNDAAQLPPDRPGAACFDSGSSIMEFRVAVPTPDPSSAEVIHRPRIRPWVPGQGLPTQHSVKGIQVGNLQQADRESLNRSPSTSPIRPVVLPPLPGPDGVTELLSSQSAGGGRNVTGIVDIPAHQRQSHWSYSPNVDGSALIIGNDPIIISSVLRSMTDSASATHRVVALGRIASALEWAEIRCGMDAGWRFHAILDHLNRESAKAPSNGLDHAQATSRGGPGDSPPTIVVCSNWNEFIDSLDHHAAGETERLLKHASGLGLTFLLAGCRSATSTGADFTTQVIFPPSAGGDGLSVGLSRQRFVGTWPQHRAVLVGPGAQEAGGDGADVQLVPHRQGTAGADGRAERRRGFEPRWRGLDGGPGPVQPGLTRSSIPLGLDPFGELVVWDPTRDGAVLTVRGSPQSGKTETAAMVDKGCTAASMDRRQRLAIHDDAHLEANPDAFDLLDDDWHVVTMPVRFTPGYGSPLAKAQGLGPMLIIGAHSRHDLSNLGQLRLPPLDGKPGTAWFLTEQRAQAVRLFTAESPTCPSTSPALGEPPNASATRELSGYPQEVP